MKKLTYSIIALVMSLFVFGAALYAWFSGASLFHNIVFQPNGVDAVVTVYEGIDFNRDGYLDLEESGDERYAAITDFSPASVPTEIYTFRIEVTPKQTANVSVTLDGFAGVAKKYYAYRSAAASAKTTIEDVFTQAGGTAIAFSRVDATTTAQKKSVTLAPIRIAADATGYLYFQIRLDPCDDEADDAAYQALKGAALALTLKIEAKVSESV